MKASTLYKNKINPKMSSMGYNLNIFDLLEYIKNFNILLVNLEGGRLHEKRAYIKSTLHRKIGFMSG